jgi:hypothetical protein
MKTHYDKLANCAGYHKGNKVWLYRPTCKKRKLPKLQSSWEGLYNEVTQINDVVYRIQRNLRLRLMVVHLDWLALYQGAARDKWPYEGSSGRVITMRTEPWGSHTSQTQPLEKKKWQYAHRLFRKNSLKEGAMWHIDLLLGNNHETNETIAIVRKWPARQWTG